MKLKDFIIRICGSSGDGSLAAGQVLNLAAARMGYHIMNFDSYPAEIRGFGKSVAHTRIRTDGVLTPGEKANCLIALNEAHSVPELDHLTEEGVVLFETLPAANIAKEQRISSHLKEKQIGYPLPLRELSIRSTQGAAARNIVALGVLAQIFSLSSRAFEAAIRERFRSKSEKIGRDNLRAFRAGHQFAAENIRKRDTLFLENKIRPSRERMEILSGNEAAAKACLDAKVRLFAGYPITPATKIMEVLAKELPKQGGTVVQTEDEISALGHILGGGFAGERCVTATSGPGLALMVELLGLGVMAEIPAVVIDCQRSGPSTGIPTKTEQSDLNLAVFGGSGDSPRPVLAPTTVEECYSLTREAFLVAEAFQTPVIILLDAFLANRMENLIWKKVLTKRFNSFSEARVRGKTKPYERYAQTPSGISPRSVPGMEGFLYTATGLEHDARGLPNYTAKVHEAMTAKRHRKMAGLLEQWPPPEEAGEKGALDVGILAWGSSVGGVKELLPLLEKEGIRAGGLFPKLLWPMETKSLAQFAKRSKKLLAVEMNYSGQLARLAEQKIHREIFSVGRLHTDPLPVSLIAEEVKKL